MNIKAKFLHYRKEVTIDLVGLLGFELRSGRISNTIHVLQASLERACFSVLAQSTVLA